MNSGLHKCVRILFHEWHAIVHEKGAGFGKLALIHTMPLTHDISRVKLKASGDTGRRVAMAAWLAAMAPAHAALLAFCAACALRGAGSSETAGGTLPVCDAAALM
jgi:hypothetical protein